MFSTGVRVTKGNSNNFSELNWGEATASYGISIKKVLSNKYSKLSSLATAFNQSKKVRVSKILDATVGFVDRRSNIQMSSDVEE